MTAREQAIVNDNKLLDMATYAVSAGQTKLCSMHDPVFMHALQDKFNYFKRLVRTGEFTMQQLEDKIYTDYGIVVNTDPNHVVGFGPVEDPIDPELSKQVDEALAEDTPNDTTRSKN